MQTNDQETLTALFKISFVWLCGLIGSVTLQQIYFVIAIFYALAQLFILIRDKIIRDKREDES